MRLAERESYTSKSARDVLLSTSEGNQQKTIRDRGHWEIHGNMLRIRLNARCPAQCPHPSM
eukprot:4990410-Amphidinium_carterae.1